jgi:S-adenosylmethionine-diacylglycerol 3-amino-3-carboxypropyl transferase
MQAMGVLPDRKSPASEAAQHADFSGIRYAQCWEDADVLLDALAVRPGDRCLSVASGGENSLSLLACEPGAVVAVDISPAQIALVELKRAAIRTLDHATAIAFIGLAPCADRLRVYRGVRAAMPRPGIEYWDSHLSDVAAGVCTRGRFERYLALFRRVVLPLVHSRAATASLLEPRPADARRRYFDEVWNNRRWRMLTRVFFSRTVMSHLGRDPSFFRFVEGDVVASISKRVERTLTEGEPAANPCLHWIAHGRYGETLPHAWRPANFDTIRRHLDRLELRRQSAEEALASAPDGSFDRFNLSDVFEYVSAAAAERMFDDVARCGRTGGRVAYWNMMVPRAPPARLAGRLRALDEDSRRLHRRATTFFYGAFRVDELIAGHP